MKNIRCLFFIFIISVSLVGCKNTSTNKTDENTENHTSINKTDENNNDKSDNEIKDIFKLLSDTYWIEEDQDYGEVILKINDSIVEEYFTGSDYYSAYEINKINYDSDKNTLTLNTTAHDYDESTDLDLHIELLDEKTIRLKVDKDYTLNLKSTPLNQLVKLIYDKGSTTFDNGYIQDILDKTEDELYGIIGLFYPSELDSSQIKYVESKLAKDEIIKKITSLQIFTERSSTYPVIHDEDIGVVSVGSKLGYLITVRSYGEVTDSRMEDIFLDIDSGNIYLYDYFDTMRVNLNSAISKIEI